MARGIVFFGLLCGYPYDVRLAIVHLSVSTCHASCAISISDSMVQPQMDQKLFKNVSNLVLVEPNRIRDSIYVCNRLLFANFLTLKMSHI